MTTRNPQKKSGSAAHLKMVVTAASLTAVIGGWASLTFQQTWGAGAEEVETQIASDEAEELTYELEPLPTLVPEPTFIPYNRQYSVPVSIAGLPSAQPVLMSAQVTPVVALNLGKDKPETERGGQGKPDKQPKEPVTNTRSS
jgi:hypothetical protein